MSRRVLQYRRSYAGLDEGSALQAILRQHRGKISHAKAQRLARNMIKKKVQR